MDVSSRIFGKRDLNKELLLQNISLKQELKEIKERVNFKEGDYLKAKVYTFSPFNHRKNLLVNLGRKEGVKIGWPVLLKKKIFLGRVIKVFSHQSEIETIFSSHFKCPVLLQDKNQALVFGGGEPQIKYIPLRSEIKEGDNVYVLMPGLAYVYLGKIKDIKNNSSFKQARVCPDIKYKEINEVFIYKND